MIEQLTNQCQLDEYLKTDLYAVRIKSLLKAYGCKYPFAVFYRQITGGKITAAVSRLDDNITLSFDACADPEELREFFSVCGYHTLLCSGDFSMPAAYENGWIMETVQVNQPPRQNIVLNDEPDLAELYPLLETDEHNFDSWYADLNHRIRHGCAKAAVLQKNGEPAPAVSYHLFIKNMRFYPPWP